MLLSLGTRSKLIGKRVSLPAQSVMDCTVFPQNLYIEILTCQPPWVWVYLEMITDLLDMNLSKLRELVEDRGVWCATQSMRSQSQAWLSYWTASLNEVMWAGSESNMSNLGHNPRLWKRLGCTEREKAMWGHGANMAIYRVKERSLRRNQTCSGHLSLSICFGDNFSQYTFCLMTLSPAIMCYAVKLINLSKNGFCFCHI